MANERVSQLNELLAEELQTIDLFLITDMSLKESKKLELSKLILFLQNSASFNAVYAQHCISASYVPGTGVDGPVSSASNAVWSINSGHANTADSCISASWSDRSGHADSASWAPPPIVGVTSSYSLRSGYSDYAGTAYFLYYNGFPNGTASYAISSSQTISSSYAKSSSVSDSSFSSVSSSFSDNSNISYFSVSASFLMGNYNPNKAWSWITWSVGVLFPQIILGYNISSVKWLGNSTTAAPFQFGSIYYNQFGVEFLNALSNNNYTLIGTGYKAYPPNYQAQVFMHPIYGNRTPTSFTMSIVTSTLSDFYTQVSASYPNDYIPWVNFQILGL